MSEGHKKIKLLQLEPVSDSGGVTGFIEQLVKYLPLETFETHFAASGNGHAFELMRERGVIAHTLDDVYTFWTFRKNITTFRLFLKQHRFDIVHAHTVRAAFLAIRASRGLPIKVICTFHGWRFLQIDNPIKRLWMKMVEKHIVRHADAMTYLTESECSIGKNIAPAVLHVVIPFSISIPDTLTSSSFRSVHQINDTAFVIVMIGRLSHQKDPETFVRTAALLAKDIPDSIFLWIGNGDKYDTTIALAKNLGLGDKIIFTSEIAHAQVLEVLRESNILLFTSHFEGLPIVILEGMASKLPIVAAAVGGIPEIIIPYTNGLLFREGDAQEAAKQVMSLYNDKALQNNIKEAAFHTIMKDYSPQEKMAHRFAELYKKLYAPNH